MHTQKEMHYINTAKCGLDTFVFLRMLWFTFALEIDKIFTYRKTSQALHSRCPT